MIFRGNIDSHFLCLICSFLNHFFRQNDLKTLLTKLSFAEDAVAVKPKILKHNLSFGECISDVLRHVSIGCEGDELAAHALIFADQVGIRHIAAIEGADSRGVDLEGNILFNNGSEDIENLLFEDLNVDASVIFSVDVAQGAGQMGKHVEIRFFDHFGDMEEVFFHEADNLFFGHGRKIYARVAIVDLFEGDAMDGAKDDVEFTEPEDTIGVFGIVEIFCHFHALQDLQTITVCRTSAANVLHAIADRRGCVQFLRKPHIDVVADGDALQALLDRAFANLVDRLLAIDGMERMDMKIKHREFLSYYRIIMCGEIVFLTNRRRNAILEVWKFNK